MSIWIPRYIVLAAGLLGMLSGPMATLLMAQAASSPASAQSIVTGKRSVTFDFAGLDASGIIQLGKPFKLSLSFNGVVQSDTLLVAVCESVYFQRQIVTMEPDPSSMTMQATAILEPLASGKLSVVPKVARIHVMFARVRPDNKLERVMTRIVYVTLGQPDEEPDTHDLTHQNQDDLNEQDGDGDDIQSEIIPISTEQLVEENLLPLPEPGRGRAYWQQISALLSRSWSRTARRVRQAPSSETVRVRFRMYPNGRAQLIEIEKGSGAREIDEAGIHAVVHAQPFPPFPVDIGSEPVEVHVRMRTGSRAGSRVVRQIADSPASKPKAELPAPKK
jgi:TonB family protein